MTAYAFQISRDPDKRWSGDEPPDGPDWKGVLRRILNTVFGSLAFALAMWGLIVGIFCIGG